ncbi:MAG: T9SS type A sorting domain-containing protein, partial [Saprospiraceae bacterium]|nr:T9SS type A sorting domain-containing protein [Saprospiraceae bacterium]
GTVIAESIVSIPSGTTVIDLGFQVPIGTDYLLTTDADFSLNSIGSSSPQLRRSTAGITFPYVVDGVLSIKNSSFDQTRYYYFYDWKVELPGIVCESDRVQVWAFFPQNSSVKEPTWAAGMQLFPNPTSGMVKVQIPAFSGGGLQLSLKNAQGSQAFSKSFHFAPGVASLELEFNQLPKGIYWLEFSSNDGISVRKVIVQ